MIGSLPLIATVDPRYHDALAVARLTDARPPPLTVSFGYLKHFLMLTIAILIYQPAWFWYVPMHFPRDVARAVAYCLVAERPEWTVGFCCSASS